MHKSKTAATTALISWLTAAMIFSLSAALIWNHHGARAFIAQPQASGTPGLQQLKDTWGINALEKAASYTFYTLVNQQPIFLLQVPASEDGLAQASKALPEMYENKAQELIRTFSIRLGQEDEVTSASHYCEFSRQGPGVKARRANLGELYVLGYALHHSFPGHLLGKHKDSDGIKIYFLKEMRALGAAGDWGYDIDLKPAIFIEPDYVQNRNNLEAILLHELAHNSLFRLGFDPCQSDKWKMSKSLGWQPYFNFDTNESGWLLQTVDGSLYKLNAYSNQWVRCNKSGQPLNLNGQRVKSQHQAKRLSTPEIMSQARITPATSYFPSPVEELAEALMLFRRDRSHRALLLKRSPVLYRLVKQHDQLELDRTYGSDKLVRGLDGIAVANQRQIQQEIRDFESEQSTAITGGILKAPAISSSP